MIETKLYLGLETKSGTKIQDSQIAYFMREVVAKKFQGFTYYRVNGFFEGEYEDSMILEIIHNGARIDHESIHTIGETYAGMFHQVCVLRTDKEIEGTIINRKIA